MPSIASETTDLFRLFEQSGVLLAVKDAESGLYMYVCDRMAALLGRCRQDILGAHDAELLTPEETALMRAAEKTVRQDGVVQRCEHRLTRFGQVRQFGVSRMLWSAGPQSLLLISAWVEMTEALQCAQQLLQALNQLEHQQQALEALKREAQNETLHAPGSGLYQFGHFEDQLRRELDLSSREHREFALVSIAIDSLKDPTHGTGSNAHHRVLDTLGRLLRSNTRAMDASCRLDDRRFAVLLSGVGLATAHSRMEHLRRQCATQIVVLERQNLGFTVSMGVASFPHTAQTKEQLIHAAEAALAEAERRGGNQVTLASIKFNLG